MAGGFSALQQEGCHVPVGTRKSEIMRKVMSQSVMFVREMIMGGAEA